MSKAVRKTAPQPQSGHDRRLMLPTAPEPKLEGQVLKDLALTQEEMDRVRQLLRREPNLLEAALFGVMWSEHCSYKSSRVFLKTLPTTGKNILQGPGENAGVVDIGHGLAAVFKIESHNHPSAVEPYQGAATGVGGILRDIFTMGARPVALMDALRFGNPKDAHVRYLLDGVVAGIGGYGNCMGVPTVGGEVQFHTCYQGNPLVNALCLGIARHEDIVLARAKGEGNPVFLVGGKTGRDGIHGATFASEELTEESQKRRPSVQVGDPFTEKLLLEATLEALGTGACVAVQDLGAAGVTCSTSETAARGGVGMVVDLEKCPLRESGMTPLELCLSESQERMLFVVQKGREAEVMRIFKKWGLDAARIGHISKGKDLVMRAYGKEVARVQADLLTEDAPVYRRPLSPRQLPVLKKQPPLPGDFAPVLKKMLASPAFMSAAGILKTYDHQVQTGTVLAGACDASVVWIKEAGHLGLALSTDGNGRWCQVNPREGTRWIMAESVANLTAVGAEALATTNNLNFASPERPEVMWDFAECVAGLGEACRAFGAPVTGGNVSFYNERGALGAIFPSPVVGVLGKLKDTRRVMRQDGARAGDTLYLLGDWGVNLGGSEYLETLHGQLAGPLTALDLKALNGFFTKARKLLGVGAAKGFVHACHDIASGGLLLSALELAWWGGAGLSLSLPARVNGKTARWDGLLFDETPGRFLLAVPAAQEKVFLAEAQKQGLSPRLAGVFTPRGLRVVQGKQSLFSGKLPTQGLVF